MRSPYKNDLCKLLIIKLTRYTKPWKEVLKPELIIHMVFYVHIGS